MLKIALIAITLTACIDQPESTPKPNLHNDCYAIVVYDAWFAPKDPVPSVRTYVKLNGQLLGTTKLLDAQAVVFDPDLVALQATWDEAIAVRELKVGDAFEMSVFDDASNLVTSCSFELSSTILANGSVACAGSQTTEVGQISLHFLR